MALGFWPAFASDRSTRGEGGAAPQSDCTTTTQCGTNSCAKVARGERQYGPSSVPLSSPQLLMSHISIASPFISTVAVSSALSGRQISVLSAAGVATVVCRKTDPAMAGVAPTSAKGVGSGGSNGAASLEQSPLLLPLLLLPSMSSSMSSSMTKHHLSTSSRTLTQYNSCRSGWRRKNAMPPCCKLRRRRWWSKNSCSPKGGGAATEVPLG